MDHLLEVGQEFLGSVIAYESPKSFAVRPYNQEFESFMDQIKSSLNSRRILTRYELARKYTNVIYQKKQSGSIYRAEVSIYSSVKNATLRLIDEGNKTVEEPYDEITLYNYVDSDFDLPEQIVIDCKLHNVWFPVMDKHTKSTLKPYFDKDILYKILIVKNCKFRIIYTVQMVQKDTNVDICDIIMKSGVGTRKCAAMKTDELPYEENLLLGQSFLSYIYLNHFKLYIQPEPNIVDELEEEIKEYIKENPEPESLDMSNLRNSYCLATVNNDQWYRAYVKTVNEDSFIVNMFDIGFLTEVSLKQIRPIKSSLMKKPQLCLHCNLENKDFTLNINTEKVLFNITVKSKDPNGVLRVTIKEHHTAPLSNPVVRSIEKVSFVHVDGDLTYLQRCHDKSKTELMSKNLSKLNGELMIKPVVVGDMVMFESHGEYYRCVVKSINSKMAVVRCVDFGYERLVEKQKLQCLGPSKIALLPALVTVVKTFPIASNMALRRYKISFLANIRVDDDGCCMPLNALTHHNSTQTRNGPKGTPTNTTVVKSSVGNDLVIPDVETVTIEEFKSFHNFFTKSETVSTLYMERINSELEKYNHRLSSDEMSLNSNPSDYTGTIIVVINQETGHYCRALLKYISSYGYGCYMVDHNDYDIYEEIYMATDFLRECPPIWRCCSLYAPNFRENVSEIWFPNVNDMFRNISSVEGIKFNMVVVRESVAIYETDDYGLTWCRPDDEFKHEVKLLLDNVDLSEILCPVDVQARVCRE